MVDTIYNPIPITFALVELLMLDSGRRLCAFVSLPWIKYRSGSTLIPLLIAMLAPMCGHPGMFRRRPHGGCCSTACFQPYFSHIW